jgi:hypothetical protein
MPRTRLTAILYLVLVFASGILVGVASNRLYTVKASVKSNPAPRNIEELIPGGQAGGLFGALLLILLLELVDAAGGIDQLLLSGKERVAVRADFDADVVLVGGSCAERMSARADHVHLIVGRVNSSFHWFTSGNFLGNLHVNTRLRSDGISKVCLRRNDEPPRGRLSDLRGSD